MSNRFRPAGCWSSPPLYLRAGQSAGNRQHRLSKANIFALLKYRGTLDESLKNRALPYAGSNSPPGRKCWRG